jgi:hypothetical protein
MADWTPYLQTGEDLRWEGRPAPRCHTFRHWRLSLAGAMLLALLGGWHGAAVPLGAPLLPAMLVLAVAVVAVFLLLALPLWQRLTWESIFYAISDRRLLVARGRRIDVIPLQDITTVRIDLHGAELGTLSVEVANGPTATLFCLEHPRIAAQLLRKVEIPLTAKAL